MGLAVPRGTNKLYVGNEGSNSVSVISLSRREVITTIDVGSRPHHMHASADGSRVYVAEFGTNKIGVIDTMTDTLIAEWATGSPTEWTHAPAPTHDGKTLYAVNSTSNTLVALDAHTGAIQWSMTTGANPSELHITHDGRTGYLSVRNDDVVEVLDLAARQVTRRIPVGDQPDTVQLSPDEQTLIVANRGTPAEVDVINLRSFAVAKFLFPAERLAGHNWLSANGRYTFVSLDDPGAVGVIDHKTNSIVATWPYPGGGSVHGMFYDDPRAAGGPGDVDPETTRQSRQNGNRADPRAVRGADRGLLPGRRSPSAAAPEAGLRLSVSSLGLHSPRCDQADGFGREGALPAGQAHGSCDRDGLRPERQQEQRLPADRPPSGATLIGLYRRPTTEFILIRIATGRMLCRILGTHVAMSVVAIR